MHQRICKWTQFEHFIICFVQMTTNFKKISFIPSRCFQKILCLFQKLLFWLRKSRFFSPKWTVFASKIATFVPKDDICYRKSQICKEFKKDFFIERIKSLTKQSIAPRWVQMSLKMSLWKKSKFCEFLPIHFSKHVHRVESVSVKR